MQKIKSKLPATGTSIFAVMSKMANDNNAINLSQGFPDFNCSEKLIELVHKFMREGYNQYSPMPGVPALREALCGKIKNLYGAEYNVDTEITVTSGATQAIFTAINAFVNTGDEVIIFEPAYDSYKPSVQVNGGIPVPVPLKEDTFTIDWERTESAVNSKTRMIIVNVPHNPCGTLLTKDDINRLSILAEKHDLLVVSDEVYEHIVFDGVQHLSPVSDPALRERTIHISSFGKMYHTTGWKTGYAAAPAALTSEFRKVHQFTVYCVNTPVQHAYAEFLKDESQYLELSSFYQKKRDLLIDELSGSRFKITPAQGTYFQLLDYSDITDKSDMEFSEYLTKQAGVAVIPLSPFYTNKKQNKYIRVCFAKTDKILKEAAGKLKKV